MRIITWNIACLPKQINILRNPNKAIYNIIDKIFSLEPNVICLQELFDYKLQNIVIDSLKSANYNYHISEQDGIISKNGLLTASNYNIIDKTETNYLNFTGPEYLIKKGLLSTNIEIDNYNNNNIYIHNTHLQSNSMGYYKNVCEYNRQRQHAEINYILKDYKNDVNILCGDINDDFESKALQKFFSTLPFNEKYYNKEKIITFPKYKEQLDYILVNKQFRNITYDVEDVTSNLLSDHNILICNILD